MKIAYCRECKEVIAAGSLPAAHGKSPARYTHASKSGKKGTLRIHEGVLVDVPATPRLPGERAGAYLARLGNQHAELLEGIPASP